VRKVFEHTIEIENTHPPKENPGPGHYKDAEYKDKKTFNS